MQIICIPPQGFAANSYIVTADGKNAVVVDPAQPRVEDEVRRRGLVPAFVLLTHVHFDHIGGVRGLRYLGAKVLCSADEAVLIGSDADLCEAFGALPPGFSADGTFSDGEAKELCGLTVEAVFTPGHTAGSMCYLVRDEKDGGRVLFTGDTLFRGSVGRTDFPTGSDSALRQSLKKLARLDGGIPVYPGHGEGSTLADERENNPFLIGL